jgi:hypothetical protein
MWDEPVKTIAVPLPISPAIRLRRLVRHGLLPALAFALAADSQLVDISKECRGAFSSGFSAGFDVHRCKMTIQGVGTNLKISIPMPVQ